MFTSVRFVTKLFAAIGLYTYYIQ